MLRFQSALDECGRFILVLLPLQSLLSLLPLAVDMAAPALAHSVQAPQSLASKRGSLIGLNVIASWLECL